MAGVSEIDALTRSLLDHVAATVKSARLGRRWSQRRLGRVSGCSQSVVARMERATMPELSFRTASRVLRALSIEAELRLLPPRVETPPVRDRAHARCVAALSRRLVRAGFEVATEVEVGSGRWRGFIDVIAMNPVSRLLFVWEVKTALYDIGAADRQLRSYVDAAWAAATGLGWRPRGVTGILVLLATTENDRRLTEHRGYFDRAFTLRSREMRPLLGGSTIDLPARGASGLVMLDPASRRVSWLLPTAIDGRRTPARYADGTAFLVARARGPRRASLAPRRAGSPGVAGAPGA